MMRENRLQLVDTWFVLENSQTNKLRTGWGLQCDHPLAAMLLADALQMDVTLVSVRAAKQPKEGPPDFSSHTHDAPKLRMQVRRVTQVTRHLPSCKGKRSSRRS